MLAQVRRLSEDAGETPHERYLVVYRFIRDSDLAAAFDDMWRSMAVAHIARIRSLKLWSDEEVARFAGAPRSSASGKLEHSILARSPRMGTARAPAAAVGHEGDGYPGRMKKQAGQQHELPRYGTDRRPRKKIVDRAYRGGMDQQLANIGSHLNEENPAVIVP